MNNKNWTVSNITDQTGKTILITGANSGLGLEAAKVLSKKGGNIIMAVRNPEKGKEAAARIMSDHPNAKLEMMLLDLADLNSVLKFSDEFHARYSRLHILINNAGIMYPVKREVTKQNFEIQFGTNHLGHFALTGLLLDIIKATPQSRVVTQSSIMHKVKADIHLDDLNWEKSYNKVKAYSQSKLANLLFTYELDRQFKIHQIDAISVAAHPGYTDINLQKTSGFSVNIINKLIGQKVEMGTLPLLRAATEDHLFGAEYFGPTKMGELRGYPEKVNSSDKSYDTQLAKDLWAISVKMSGVHFNFQQE